ncbi:MAG: phosphotransferase, partial [Myxococcota bacterium]
MQRAVAVILDGEDAEQARNVFGGGAASAIGASVAAWVDAHVDAEVVQCTDPHVSIGVVLGLSLANGSRRVLKATRPRLALSAALNVQGRLARSGYPAPAIVAGPEQCAAADVVLMTALDSGERVVCDASVRATMAEEFARLVALANEEAPAAALVPAARDTSRVWPTPHSVIFDFDATMEGAEWIDAIAVRTHAVLDADRRPGVVAHGDWSLQNVAFRGQRLVAVFDWDSLTVVPEPIAVARAAAFHCQDWSRGPRGDGASFYPGPA